MRMLLPIILVLLGVVGGGAVGFVLKPEPEPIETADVEAEAPDEAAAEHDAAPLAARDVQVADSDYFPLSRKIIVPFVRASGVEAFVAIDLHVEIEPGQFDFVQTHEPKLIDVFLRTVITFAATGAFEHFSRAPQVLDELNAELLKGAQAALGPIVRDILIANMITRDA